MFKWRLLKLVLGTMPLPPAEEVEGGGYQHGGAYDSGDGACDDGWVETWVEAF